VPPDATHIVWEFAINDPDDTEVTSAAAKGEYVNQSTTTYVPFHPEPVLNPVFS
jgi:hypothetical protein